MLIEKICTMINADHDEDFNVYQRDNKIFIDLEGFQFKNKAKIIISDNHLVYKEKNTEYNYNAYNEYDLMNYLHHIIEKRLKCNISIDEYNFKKKCL